MYIMQGPSKLCSVLGWHAVLCSSLCGGAGLETNAVHVSLAGFGSKTTDRMDKSVN